MSQKSVLVLSGGLDSTVSSWMAREKSKPLVALTFDYGQKAVKREVESARYQADVLGVPHQVISLPWLGHITKTSLVNDNEDLPQVAENELDNTSKTFASAKAVWVPNRNGVFLNIGAAYAESMGAELVITGFNIEEGVTFPDNSTPFVRAADEFFWYSTLNRVKVASYTVKMNKVEIATKARDLGIDLSRIWFCYDKGKTPCRQCESCQRSFRAFREVGLVDPWA